MRGHIVYVLRSRILAMTTFPMMDIETGLDDISSFLGKGESSFYCVIKKVDRVRTRESSDCKWPGRQGMLSGASSSAVQRSHLHLYGLARLPPTDSWSVLVLRLSCRQCWHQWCWSLRDLSASSPAVSGTKTTHHALKTNVQSKPSRNKDWLHLTSSLESKSVCSACMSTDSSSPYGTSSGWSIML